MTGAAIHRVSQFWRHSSARVSASELRRAEAILGPTLSPFFLELPVNDRRHGLDVLATVDGTLSSPPTVLQQAALLHDIGKTGAALSVLERSATVFLAAVSPGLLRAALRLRPGLERRYAIYAAHAQVGAERLRAVGAVELAAVIAEHHSENPTLEMTSALQRADHVN